MPLTVTDTHVRLRTRITNAADPVIEKSYGWHKQMISEKTLGVRFMQELFFGKTARWLLEGDIVRKPV